MNLLDDVEVGNVYETNTPGVTVVILYIFEENDLDYQRYPFLGVVQGAEREREDRWSITGKPRDTIHYLIGNKEKAFICSDCKEACSSDCDCWCHK